MASSTQVTAANEGPLSFMQRLSPAVSYLDPQLPSSNRDPKLILVLSWMAAREAHIEKYISQHRRLFPSSRILLARFPMDHVYYPPGREAQLSPVLPFLEKAVAEDDGDVFVHVFSNGGVSTLVKLVDMMRRGTTLCFPRHVMVLDSCPGYFHWQSTHLALAQSLPSWMSSLVHLGMGVMFALNWPFGYAPSPDVNADAANETHLLERTARRTYVYGDEDSMVDWRDVEKHAGEAEKRAAVVVRRELFEGGKHVAHVRVDAERYWRVVSETWLGVEAK